MKQIYRFIAPYLKEQRAKMVTYTLLSILLCLLNSAIPYVTGVFLDELIDRSEGSQLVKYMIIFLVMGCLQFVFGYFVSRLYEIVQVNGAYKINISAIRRVQEASLKKTNHLDTGYLGQQINNDANLSTMYCINTIKLISMNSITLVIAISYITKYSVLMGGITLLFNLLYFIVFRALKNPIYKSDYEVMEAQSHYFSKELEQLQNVKYVQVHGVKEKFTERLNKCKDNLLEKAMWNQKVNYGFEGADVLLKALGIGIAFIIGGAAVIQHKLTVGELTIIISYFSMSFAAMQYFFTLGRDTQEIRVCCERLDETLSIEKESEGESRLNEITSIECKNVTFSYEEDVIVNNFNYQFEKGHIYGLVGKNGTGKSTIIDLLVGLYRDDIQGEILYNNQSPKVLDMNSVRERLVAVSEQEPQLLCESLLFNLTLDRFEPDDEKLREYCEILSIREKIDTYEEGLNTTVNESSNNLSGGEKQKIALIRSLLKNADLLILDEPSSALDEASKERLLSFLEKVKRDKIIIISTHDKDIISICDKKVEIVRSA